MNQEIDLKVIQLDLINIQKKLKSWFWNANEFFYITKPTEEILNRYVKVAKINGLKRILWFLKFPIKIIFWYLINVIYSLIKSGKEIQLNGRKFQSLFISHLTRENPNYENGDRIYGDIINCKKSKNLNLIYYLNHQNSHLSIDQNRIRNSISQEFILNSKNLPCFKMIKLINENYFNVLHLYIILLFRNAVKPVNPLWFGVAEFQLKRSTFANLVVATNLKYILKSNSIRNLVMTFEGHAYEYLAYKIVQSISPSTRIFMYQHSPISHGQQSIFSFVEHISTHVTVMFSSKSVLEYFKKYIESEYVVYKLIGSKKYNLGTGTNFDASRILLAPEGINSVLRDFLFLAPKIRKFSNQPLLLRMHPALKKNLINYLICKWLLIKGVIEISDSKLESDLKEAKICIFRASSVGLEAISKGINSIFFGTEWENIFVNPLNLVESNTHYLDYQLSNIYMLINLESKKYNYFSKLNLPLVKRILS